MNRTTSLPYLRGEKEISKGIRRGGGDIRDNICLTIKRKNNEKLKKYCEEKGMYKSYLVDRLIENFLRKQKSKD